MEAGFAARKRELLKECKMAPEIFEEVVPRLEAFMVPYLKSFVRTEQVGHAMTFVQGLLSDLDRKNVESIAYRFGQERMPLQWFMGVSNWDHHPLIDTLVEQIGQTIGARDGVIVFDPSGFAKAGCESVGVIRQWCGRLGKIDNCQVAIFMGYVSGHEHALVDTRLYLPREWTNDRKRLRKAGVPKEIRYRTRHQLCLEMLQAHGEKLPHQWITGDDEMGRPFWFRRKLHQLHEQYLLAVPCNTLIRDLEAAPPEASGPGRKPLRPWVRVDRWTSFCSDDAWTRIDVRDGAKGPIIVEAMQRRVVARSDKQPEGHEEVLVIIRYKDRDDQRVIKTDYYLSNAKPDTKLSEFTRVAKAEHRIEECLQRAKSEAGLADYELRKWKGWHHHQALVLVANWFLIEESRRGKKNHASDYTSADPRRHRLDPPPSIRMRYPLPNPARTRDASMPKRTGTLIPLEAS